MSEVAAMLDKDSQNSKALILSRVRQSQKLSRLPDIKKEAETAVRSPDEIAGDCLSRFQKELAGLGVRCYVEKSWTAIANRVEKITTDKCILSWDMDLLPDEIEKTLSGKKVLFGHDDVAEQAKADIGLTGCDAAIAETGSLVLCSGKGKPKTASLLPYTHLALIHSKDIFFTMGEFFAKKRTELEESSYLNIITGPSRTADIELSLTLGVHGPGEVIVIVGS